MPTPETSDYPPLMEWLLKHDAKCIWYVSDWERGVKKPLRHVEAWLVRGALVLVVLYAERRGWHIYTEANTTDIAAQFADVERRIGLSDPNVSTSPPRTMPRTEAQRLVDDIVNITGDRVDERRCAVAQTYLDSLRAGIERELREERT